MPKNLHLDLYFDKRFPFVHHVSPNGYLALPSGPYPKVGEQSDEESNITLTAQQLLGLTVIGSTRNGKEPHAIFHGRRGHNAIAIHNSDQHLQPTSYAYTGENGEDLLATVPGLFEIARYGHYDWTLYLGAHDPDRTAFAKHIESLRAQVNDTNAEYLTAIENWVRMHTAQGGMARNLWIIGPEHALVPNGDLPKASIGGKVVDFSRAGSVLHSLLHRLPASYEEVYPREPSGKREHERQAFPYKQLIRKEEYLRVRGTGLAFGYWAYGQISPEVLGKILKKDIDILLRVEFIQGETTAHFTALLRTSVSAQNIGKLYELDRELWEIGHFGRVVGPDLEDAWFSYTFSRPLPRKFYRHSVPGWIDVQEDEYPQSRDGILAMIAKSLAPVGDPGGYVALGVYNGVVYLIDPSLEPAWLYTGESTRAGKSTTIPFHAMQETTNIIWIDLTASLMDSPRKWVRDFGSEPIVLDLPDADTILTGKGAYPSKEEVKRYQEQFHRDDIKDARRVARGIFKRWGKAGRITGLPLTFDLKSGNTIRYLNWLDQFLLEFRECMEDWHARTGQYLILVIDNFSHLNGQQQDHAVLDDLPWKIAVNLAKTIVWFVNQGRNHGIRLRVATHDKADFKPLVGDVYTSFGWHFDMGGNKVHNVRLIIPRTGEVHAVINMHLTDDIRQYTERLTPAQIRDLEKSQDPEPEVIQEE